MERVYLRSITEGSRNCHRRASTIYEDSKLLTLAEWSDRNKKRSANSRDFLKDMVNLEREIAGTKKHSPWILQQESDCNLATATRIAVQKLPEAISWKLRITRKHLNEFRGKTLLTLYAVLDPRKSHPPR